MAYSADTFVADEQPTTAKWNKLWSNDASFNDGTGIGDNAILTRHITNSNVTSSKLSFETVETKLSSTFNSAASNTWQDTGMKLTLPTAGLWIVMANLRTSVPSAGNFSAVRLYNQTTGAAVTDGDRIGNLGAGSSMQTDTPIFQLVTTTTINNIIRAEIQPGGAYIATVSSDTNGKSRITAIRIGL